MTGPAIVCVFGISGVGKTWLVSRALAGIHTGLHLQASALIKQGLANTSTDSEMLRRSPEGRILSNQIVLVDTFEHAIAETDAAVIVFDGHLVIDSDQRLIEIPLDVIAALRPDLLIHVEDEPKVIALRRSQERARLRPIRSEAVLSEHQAQSRALCMKYGAAIGVPSVVLKAGAVVEFGQILLRTRKVIP